MTDEQLYALFNSAYDQWRDNSLDYPFLHKSYQITGYHLSPNTSGPKYSYRMQLLCDPLRHPTDLFWTRPLAPVTARCSLALSYVITWLTKDSQGRDNLLGRLARKIIHKGH